MNLLPSLNMYPVPGHEEYSIIECQALERVDRNKDGSVPSLWRKKIYVKLDLTTIDPVQSPKVIAAILNTMSEQLEGDDYDTYALVPEARVYGLTPVI